MKITKTITKKPKQAKSKKVKALRTKKFSGLIALDMSSPDKKLLTDLFIDQMKTVGFILLKNVKGYDENKLLKAIKAFHKVMP
jgi:predicted Fe-Mo cluster-binding NifX family protein